MRILAALLLLLGWPAVAQDEIVVGLSTARISISTTFDGSEILVFGALKGVPVAEAPRSDIIVTVAGPPIPLTVRRQDRVAGIWVNRAAMEVDRVPSFYAVQSSAPLGDILSHVSDLRHRISVQNAIRSVGGTATVEDPSEFLTALVRLREASGLYRATADTVQIREEALFDTSVALPANLVEGVYTARTFLVRDGEVISAASSAIFVEKVGLERFLYGLAHTQPLVYAMLTLAIASLSGWGASALFRYLRP